MLNLGVTGFLDKVCYQDDTFLVEIIENISVTINILVKNVLNSIISFLSVWRNFDQPGIDFFPITV